MLGFYECVSRRVCVCVNVCECVCNDKIAKHYYAWQNDVCTGPIRSSLLNFDSRNVFETTFSFSMPIQLSLRQFFYGKKFEIFYQHIFEKLNERHSARHCMHRFKHSLNLLGMKKKMLIKILNFFHKKFITILMKQIFEDDRNLMETISFVKMHLLSNEW